MASSGHQGWHQGQPSGPGDQSPAPGERDVTVTRLHWPEPESRISAGQLVTRGLTHSLAAHSQHSTRRVLYWVLKLTVQRLDSLRMILYLSKQIYFWLKFCLPFLYPVSDVHTQYLYLEIKWSLVIKWCVICKPIRNWTRTYFTKPDHPGIESGHYHYTRSYTIPSWVMSPWWPAVSVIVPGRHRRCQLFLCDTLETNDKSSRHASLEEPIVTPPPSTPPPCTQWSGSAIPQRVFSWSILCPIPGSVIMDKSAPTPHPSPPPALWSNI